MRDGQRAGWVETRRRYRQSSQEVRQHHVCGLCMEGKPATVDAAFPVQIQIQQQQKV